MKSFVIEGIEGMIACFSVKAEIPFCHIVGLGDIHEWQNWHTFLRNTQMFLLALLRWSWIVFYTAWWFAAGREKEFVSLEFVKLAFPMSAFSHICHHHDSEYIGIECWLLLSYFMVAGFFLFFLGEGGEGFRLPNYAFFTLCKLICLCCMQVYN